MSEFRINKPGEDEYAPYYAGYVSLVPAGDILATLEKEAGETSILLGSLSESQSLFRYAPGKWSVKELIGHLIDSERVFAYRALCIARGDETPLPGFDENDYMRNALFDRVSLAELAAEFETVRQSTLFLFKHLSDDSWLRRGTANNSEVTVRAVAYITAGHEIHHRNILRDKYLRTGETI